MFKNIVAAATAVVALTTGTANAPTQEPAAASEVEQVKPSQSREARDRDKFTVSRSFKAKQQIVVYYARWYAKNKMGYTHDQWRKAYWIWYQESRWDWTAENQSGAYGIPQVKWTSKITNPFRQVELGFGYIEYRYGSVDAAYEHWKANGSY